VGSPQARYTQELERIEDRTTEAQKEALFYETYYHDRERYEELAAQGFFDSPKAKEDLIRRGPSLNFDEEMGAALVAIQHETLQIASQHMEVAGERSRATGQGFYGPAVCEAFLETAEQMPVVFAGKLQENWGGDPRTRRRALQSLTGWVATRISLNAHPRLKAALGKVQGSSAFEQLLEGLPGAAAIEWALLQQDEYLDDLVTRTALRLEKEGDEATKLGLKGKLLDEELGTDERDLEEFEREETLHRRLAELQNWTERARFSEQQQVYELDMSLNYDTEAIARELGITPGHVRKVRHDYVQKVRKAAGR
jgi:hypothetical protein